MILKNQKTVDGGMMHYLGPLDNKNIILIVGRDDFQRDEKLISLLIDSLSQTNLTIIWYEHISVAANKATMEKSQEQIEKYKKRPLFHFINKIFNSLPASQKIKPKIIRLITILKNPSNWNRLLYSKVYDTEKISFRAKKLRQFVQSLGDKNIFILSRSSGGRVSILIEDEPTIKKIMCISYPLKHPSHPPEPERTLPLANLKKPFLIIQGTRDEYGGKEAATKYIFSPNVTLSFIETDHNFLVSKEVWQNVIDQIKNFIAMVY